LQDGAAELCRNEEINGLAAELGAEISKDGTDMVIKVPIMA
jgi:hypothetical protein